jgi:hypothetical protein
MTVNPEVLAQLKQHLDLIKKDERYKESFSQVPGSYEELYHLLDTLVRINRGGSDTGHLGIYWQAAKQKALSQLAVKFILDNEGMVRDAVRAYDEQDNQQ